MSSSAPAAPASPAASTAPSSDPSWPIPYTLPLPGGIPDTHRPHTEAKTTILVPKDNIAFLNPVQEYNRDLSVAVIRAWNEMRKEEAEGKWRRKREAWAKGKGKGKGKKGVPAKKSEEEGTGVTEVKDKEGGAEEETANAQPIAGPSTEVSGTQE
jgi:tRNA (guanine26-N2/guanine27-N2)-dimethyltransferase